jgi:integrase
VLWRRQSECHSRSAGVLPHIHHREKGGRLTQDRLTDRSVADIIKRRSAAAGLDATVLSGHSLRSGFVTDALSSGADVFRVMDVTRHRQVNTLKVCDRRAKAFQDHAGATFL